MYNEPVHGLDLVVYSAKDKDKHYVPVEDDEDEVESVSDSYLYKFFAQIFYY